MENSRNEGRKDNKLRPLQDKFASIRFGGKTVPTIQFKMQLSQWVCRQNCRGGREEPHGNLRVQMEQSYTMPVLAYHDHSKFNPETMKGKCVSIPACVMTQFGVNKDLRDANKFYLNFTYTIV
ncbi:hypothetical protein Fcan01_16738 [Folsomia candida]|uniref:Uncharacterized protein n=1 Tax=Folsomia candida TaxID=158441 RepID=A0A226DUH9_FOLCA|nr:hypothetical protein Fcan01_16738 [Folsomia candida]